MRIFLAALLLIFLCLPGFVTLAAEAAEFSGTPAVLPSGVIMIEGHNVTLSGIDPLASDQQCWHESRAWNCGEQALIALRHHIVGHALRCTVKSGSGGSEISAQCFRKTGDTEDDIARYLVAQGWARDRHGDSGGLYAVDENTARAYRRGIWTSRFQTAEDWKKGIPRYVAYQPGAPKLRTLPDAQSSPVSGNAANNQ